MLTKELAALRRGGIGSASAVHYPVLFGAMRQWSNESAFSAPEDWVRECFLAALKPFDDNPLSTVVLEIFSLHKSTRGMSPTDARKVSARRVRSRSSEDTIDAFGKNEQRKALDLLAIAVEQLVRTPEATQLASNLTEELPPELRVSLVHAGVTRFFASREDYKRYRGGADSISKYVATAQRSIEMVSINLSTGHDTEEIATVFEEAIVGPSHVAVTVSLLDPSLSFLMESIAPVLGISSASLVARINDTVDSLRDLRENRLALRRRSQLQVWCHRVLPNASAIILDGDHFQTGRIQLETKGFRSGMTNSWGFEVGFGTDFFAMLRDSYRNLISDGRQVM